MDGFKSSILSGIEDDGLYLNSELFYIRIIYETKLDRKAHEVCSLKYIYQLWC